MLTISLILVIAGIILVTAVWKIHPLPVLLLGAFIFGTVNGYGVLNTLNMLSSGFGNTVRGIGIIIIAGTVIGAFMEQRGALKVIARKIIFVTGEKRTPLAMSIIGYVVSICIFCDSAFIILIGLWKKIGFLAKLPLAAGAVALSMGLFASHCFIPPTPGPLAAMDALGADFGLVLLFGSIAALAAAAGGYFYAVYAGKNEVLSDPEENSAELEIIFTGHWLKAFMPIVIPLFLIASASISKVCSGLPSILLNIIQILGSPVIALSIGAVAAIFFLGKFHRDELTVEGIMGKAVADAANILVITAGGGAFGEVLKQVDFSTILPEKVSSMGVLAIFIPLFFASVIKIAQGSSTLAIVTTAGLTVPLLEQLHLTPPVMRALTCCAICCGGMMVSHTNDSFFWVVTRFSGMNVRQGLKLQTIGSLVSGISAALVLLLIAVFH